MTTQELAQEIQAHRAYLDKRRVHRNDNPHVTRIATFERGLYILYRYTNNKSGYIVKHMSNAYKATSEANARQVIAKQEQLYRLLRAAEINDWQDEN